jgi:hypothetical protein
MSFREFVASHTGRHFFDSFREFVVAFKTYVQQLTLQNKIVAAHQQAVARQRYDDPVVNQAVADAFEREVNAVDEQTPDSMPCMRCEETCSSEVSVMVGWRGAVSLLCVKCAIEIGVVDASTTN